MCTLISATGLVWVVGSRYLPCVGAPSSLSPCTFRALECCTRCDSRRDLGRAASVSKEATEQALSAPHGYAPRSLVRYGSRLMQSLLSPLSSLLSRMPSRRVCELCELHCPRDGDGDGDRKMPPRIILSRAPMCRCAMRCTTIPIPIPNRVGDLGLRSSLLKSL